MSVERRVIVGATTQERVAVVSIAIPAGGEVEIDRAWRFHGWLVDRDEECLLIEAPRRIDIDADADGG